MRKIILVVCFIILVVVISIWNSDLSFTRTGGEDFESITPPIKTSNSINDIIKENESRSKEIIVDESKSNTIVIFKDLHLKTWFMDAQYYFGKEINVNIYDDFKLPNSYNIPLYRSANNEILAVKLTYLDLTNNGVNNLHALISEDAKVKKVTNIEDYLLMEYDNFELLLKDNILYYFRGN